MVGWSCVLLHVCALVVSPAAIGPAGLLIFDMLNRFYICVINTSKYKISLRGASFCAYESEAKQVTNLQSIYQSGGRRLETKGGK